MHASLCRLFDNEQLQFYLTTMLMNAHPKSFGKFRKISNVGRADDMILVKKTKPQQQHQQPPQRIYHLKQVVVEADVEVEEHLHAARLLNHR